MWLGASRRAWVVLTMGALVISIALGVRQSFGIFLAPIGADLGAGREVFGFAIALQNLIWGLSQPFAGMIADRWGSGRVIAAGGVLYALGLWLTTVSVDPTSLYLSLGLLIGLGLSGTTFAVVLGAVGRLFPPEKRSVALGLTTAGGSLGLFFVVPGAQAVLSSAGWVVAILALAALAAFMAVLAPALGGRPAEPETPAERQTLGEALAEARVHGGYWLLTIGFFVCGFQLAFIATHLPAFLGDRAVAPWVGGAALSLIGLFNVVGSYVCGVLGARRSKARLLTGLYLARSAVIAGFFVVPITEASALVFAALMGLLWVGTVPLTSGLVAQIFGPRYMATLFGIVFLAHQLGSFAGAWLGGAIFDQTGSYDPVWLAAILLGLIAAALHWPIPEQPVARLRAQEA
jgi:predicted MFS family arabinose efflux permease